MCETGFFLSDSRCLQCSSNCKTCFGNEAYCASCNDEYYLDNNVCLKCIDNCIN